MNVNTSKPQHGHIPLKEALNLADGDVELIRNCRLIARNGNPYISRRLVEIRLAEKKKEQENAKRNSSINGPGSPAVYGCDQSTTGVGSLKQGLRKLFSLLSGISRRLSTKPVQK